MSNKNKAIVIGGGIAGKLAARVLSDFFKEVIIIERDHEPEGPVPRKGALQGEHLHALLHAGEYGLETLFPGITDSFYESGAIKINSTKDFAWFHHGVWKVRYDGGYTTTLQTRPHLEWQMERFLKKIPNVKYQYNLIVQDYLFDESENLIYGIKMKDTNGSITSLTADLIIDGSGVSSLTDNWLRKRGIKVPHEKIKIGLRYVSRFYRLPDDKGRDWRIKMIYPTPPNEKIGGTISNVEGNRYIVTISGYHDSIDEKEVLQDDSGFLNLVKKLPKPDIYNEIKHADPLSKTSIYRIPNMVWRKIDKVETLPNGLLLIGDSVCRIDPVFGQGMSVAVLEALALQELLRNNKENLQISITHFQKKAAKIIAPIWNMVITENFRYPETKGKKPLGLSFQQWYAKRIFLLSSQHQDVYDTFVKVMNLVRPITDLMQPRILKRILKRSPFR